MSINVEAKHIGGMVENSTGRKLWWKQDVINGLYKDLCSKDQAEDVKTYLRLLIEQFEGGYE